MSSAESFNFESMQDSTSIKEFVHSLLAGLHSGKVVLSSNGDKIELHPSNMLNLEVKAKKKGQTGKISIKISWKETSATASEDSLVVTV